MRGRCVATTRCDATTRGATEVARLLFAVVAILLTVGCAGPDVEEPIANEAAEAAEEAVTPDPPSAPADTSLLRGSVTHGDEGASFRPCGSEETLRLMDGMGLFATLHEELTTGLAPTAELFAVVAGSRADAPSEGAGADATAALHVEAVLYYGFEGPGCESDWDFRYRARGNEPFWMVQVDDNELRLTRSAEEDVIWPDFETIERDEGPTFRVPQTAELPEAVLTLLLRDCRDSMSGAFFGYSATFEFGEETLTGCALVGSR